MSILLPLCILSYPPGIPVISPGEKITHKVILDFLLMLEKIGSMLPGFDTNINCPERARDSKRIYQSY